jgi:hypothetical protein
MAFVLVACSALLGLFAVPARADVMVTIYNGNPAGAGTGSPTLNFSGLSQIGSFPYYGLAFGVEAQAGGGNPNGDWRPLYHDVNYSAIIAGQFNVAQNGNYTFSTRSDDGSILSIDGKVVVNNNFYQGPTTRTGTVTLSQGVHNFQVQYFQGGGGKSLDVGSGTSVNQLPAGVTIVNHSNVPQLQTTVFNGIKFDPNTGKVTNPNVPVAGTIISPAVNFDSGTGSRRSPFGLTTNYSDSTVGTLFVSNPDGGTYTFGLNSDDGSWLYIDGQFVVNDGGFHGSNQSLTPQVTGSIFLSFGQHSFEVDHFQGGGGTGVDLFLPNGVRFLTPDDLPEPTSIALFALGLTGFVAARGWRRWTRKV